MGLKRYPKIRRPGHSSVDALFTHDEHDLIVTEKIDGTNVRVCRNDDELQFGSRNVVMGTDPTEVNEMFEDVARYVSDRVLPDDLRVLEELWAEQYDMDPADVTVTLFGEGGVQHTIEEYDWTQVPQFQLFDVHVAYDGSENWCQFAMREEQKAELRERDEVLTDAPVTFFTVLEVARFLGLEAVPLVMLTTVGDFDAGEFEVPTSIYRTDDGPAEGVVIRNPTTRQKAKVISEEFAERHKSAKSKNIPESDDDVGAFVYEHVTERRIEKNIAKLLEEPGNGHDELGMELMEDLHLKVWRDVWAEDYEAIIATDWVIDMDHAHNKTANKCANHLRSLLQAGDTPVTVVDPGTGETVTPDEVTA